MQVCSEEGWRRNWVLIGRLWPLCGERRRAEQGDCSDPKSKGKSHEALAKIQARNDSGSNLTGSDREMAGVCCVLKIEPMGFVDTLARRCERKGPVKLDGKGVGFEDWKDGGDPTGDPEMVNGTAGKARCGMPSLRCPRDTRRVMKGDNGTHGSGHQSGGQGWRWKSGSRQFINHI